MKLPGPTQSRLLRARWWFIPLALLLAFWLPGANQGWYRTDTHFYAVIAQQAWDAAVEQRSLRPLFDLRAGDQVYMNKPPLVFIVHGLFIHVFGLSLWSVRIGSLLAGMIACVATTALVRRLAGWRIAMITGIVLATSMEFFRYARAISLDLWQCAFIMVFVAMFLIAIGHGRQDTRAAPRSPQALSTGRIMLALLSGVPLGLALLTKPFMALLAPILLLPLIMWRPATRRAPLYLLGAVIIGIGVTLPWHFWMHSIHPDTFVQTYVKSQSIDRATGINQTHSFPGFNEPWWYYFGVLARGHWPWIITTALGLIALWRWRARLSSPDIRLLTLSLFWTIAWLAVLSAFAGKSPRYMVIIFPMFSILSGWWAVRATAGARGRSRTMGRWAINALAPAALAVSIIASVAGLAPHKPRHASWDQLLAELDAHPDRAIHTTRRGHHPGANLSILGRGWPSPLPPTPHSTTTPPPNSYLLVHTQEAANPASLPPGGEMVISSSEFALFYYK